MTATSTNIESIKSRIAKMLATASNDASTPAEKSTAMQMASALMRRYNIEREDVEDSKSRENYGTTSIDSLWSRMTPWESSLAAFVSAYIVKGSWCVSGKEGSSRRNFGTVGQATIKFVGLGEDHGMAAATFNQLRDSLMKQCNAKWGTPVRGSGRSYAVGFVSGLFQTARAAEQAEKLLIDTQVEVSRALIRTNMLKTQAEKWYLAETGSRVTSSARRLSGIESGAYRQGVNDGKQHTQGKVRPVVGYLG
jgi:hypothetical protein